DGLQDAVAQEEIGAQVGDIKQGRGFRLGGFFLQHQSRWRGSRMSRSASPRRLVPNTASEIAAPGKITSHGATRTYSAADSESIRPHEGCGSGTPRPRNESAASTRMVEPSCAVASTISGASVLGSTWRIAIANSFMPTAREASTNGISRSVSVLERITRATV